MESSRSVLASSVAQASVSVSLHPLVLVNISDHWTRSKAQNELTKPVIGAVIGKQTGRQLELMNSFELPCIILENHVILDRDYFKIREAQYKEVFPNQEFLGWYTTGDLPTDEDVRIHKQFTDTNESPIFLKLNSNAKQSEQLPVRIYESTIDIVSGEANIQFVELTYSLVTEDSERIGIDHVARFSVSNTDHTSHVTEHFVAQCGAVKMLAPRLRLILDYVKEVESGNLPKNDDILRQIASLCSCLPVAESEAFQQEFSMQCNDITLLSYLSVLTKECSSLNKLVNKINVLYDHRGGAVRSRKGLIIPGSYAAEMYGAPSRRIRRSSHTDHVADNV